MTTQTPAPSPTETDSPPAPSPTVASRYAAFVAGRRSKWVVLVLWLLLMGIGGSLAAGLADVQDNDPETWLPSSAQSTKAVQLAERYFADKDSSTAVIVYAREGGLTQADLSKIDSDRAGLADKVAVGEVSPAVVSEDKVAAFVSVPLRTSPSDNKVLTDKVEEAGKLTADGAPAGLDVKVTGEAGSIRDFAEVYSGMDGALLGAALGVVALLLLVTYRSPVLWLIPLIAVGLASQVASGVVYLLAKHAGLVVNGQSAYVLMVLSVGVGTDYALLIIARYREELHRHEDRHTAMALAVNGSLPALAASAATVAIATLCLVFGSMNSTKGLGPVVAIGVVLVFFAMTSLLPALLVILGRWVFWPVKPRVTAGYDPNSAQGHSKWAKIAAAVGRRPRAVWVGTALVLGVMALGIAGVQTGQTQAEQFTSKVDSVTGQQLLAKHFPAGSSAPADVYVRDAGAESAAATIAKVPGVSSVGTQVAKGGWTHLTAVLKDAPDSAAAKDTVRDIRTALDGSTGPAADAVVGGQTAVALDVSEGQSAEEKLLIPLILAVVLIMLFILLRAVIASVVLLVSVVLSFAAAVGTASLLFHALDHAKIDRGLVLFGFIFLVALGVDYTIFMVTRAREEVRLRGHREGILTAVTVTGGVITSAGVVLAATFLVLAAIPTVSALQQGLLVAVGILLDTFLVRSLLVPALALDLGPRFWRPGLTEEEMAPREPEKSRADVPSTV
ncbi:MMPL family transporter [Streptomyces sp. AP-93]|uniref:MMPL family transporter n=1 Tax=Streptomyces sp. AP-93 TaxID=2929048 RepID=UPI001FAF65F3|nr:MMPL family transporter [Streptomyces sp. AP-93]MCJ0871888.1 MMPL family transporter [Streptomyces sp. AP-93]